ncbi:MAG: hypothetical protein ACXWAT_13790 [Methylobacter sp.]
MIICKKRIRNIDRYIKHIKADQEFMLASPVNVSDLEVLNQIGFNTPPKPGDTVLPSVIGPITEFNTKGKFIIHKDQELETAYRQSEWTWKEFRGRDNTVEVSKIVDVPYKRYPRTFVEPPAMELSIALDKDGNILVVSPSLVYQKGQEHYLLHAINLFLEIFNICDLRDNNLDSIIKSPVKKLNWEILPKGQQPWTRLKGFLETLRNSTAESNKAVIDKRFESINLHKPEFVAVGKAGFSGYVVFGFQKKNLYVLESNQTNNATYIFEDNWEHLSSLSKAEILNENLHKDRIIHRESWFNDINRALN